MSYDVLESSEYESDLVHYITYLNSEEPGLGDEFFFQVYDLVERIGENPYLWQVGLKTQRFSIRRAHVLPKFNRHSIYFSVIDSRVYLARIMHDREDPRSWGKISSFQT
jgi:hypothetical protein